MHITVFKYRIYSAIMCICGITLLDIDTLRVSTTLIGTGLLGIFTAHTIDKH